METGNIVLNASGVSYKYGSFVAVKGLDLQVRGGETVAVTGSNGAGKTTLLKILCGLLVPFEGSVQVMGHGFVPRPGLARRHLGYMSQSCALIEGLTAKENYFFYGVVNGLDGNIIEKKFRFVCSEFNLEKFKNKRVEKLTSGWRQLLSFSIAIMNNPSVLLLDEPTAGVDSITRKMIWDRINYMSYVGCGIVVTSHNKMESDNCSRQIFIETPVIV